MPGLRRTSACRGCGREIAFIKTVKGKTMPVNPDGVYFVPAGGPNTYVTLDGKIERGRDPEPGDTGTTIGYVSHFATCPAADSFKAKKGKKAARERKLQDGRNERYPLLTRELD